MLKVEDLKISLGKTKILSTSVLTIQSGLWALVGRNGSGKSSFLNTILQLKEPLEGQILLQSKAIQEWGKQEISKTISAVFTKPSIFGNLSVFDVVKLGRIPYSNAFGVGLKDDDDLTQKAIDIIGINDLVEKTFSTISDGEKQLVMIARAIAQNTPIIILDEPTAFLDIVNKQTIIRLLRKISNDMNKVILFSTHDVNLIPEVCDGMLWIDNGQMYSSENSADFEQTINTLFEI
ncbi:MAG: ABC transporter ATP-binding protein [Crocinitomicaceae bacterium]